MKMRLWQWLLGVAMAAHAATFVEEHGQLQVAGAELHDQHGKVVSLRGMSMFWSQWSGDFYNSDVIDWLVSDWKVTLVRAAMGVNGDADGYLVDPEGQKALVDSVVAAAIRNGIYVIIDWHDHQANDHVMEAQAFFAEMAQKYKDVPNVIWELWNEPLDTVTWTADIKPYTEQVIPAIRQYDTDNLIVVGTRSWSQRVDDVIGHQIQDPNVAYALHFYVGSHGEWLRGIADQAIAAGIPVFVTEWGIWSNGYLLGDYTGPVDLEQVLAWTDWMESRNLSSAMWSVFDKDEPSDALLPGASPSGGWDTTGLSTAGKFGRSFIRGMNLGAWVNPAIPPVTIDTIPIPGRLEAERYSAKSGIQVEMSDDVDGTGNIGYVTDGDWTEYQIDVSAAGLYPLVVRYASAGLGGMLTLSEDGVTLRTIRIPVTGDWQAWASVSDSVSLHAGIHTLRLDFSGDSGDDLFNLNYLDIGTSTTPTVRIPRAARYSAVGSAHFDLVGRRIPAASQEPHLR